ncbi:MAG TPA: 7-carboxy-7-deazaguanine synthase QueE [Methanocella sp.]|uniref:7-carboxy-7-deazaguanine synthase QueE n=1 Tax=Methanocella sp. TaxID=2052833 RepID=UPI002D0817DD|nr:7-carboxy-7-deazaguanine synthase QueE [Methanocella sp.]HTY90998.1 7-carboxy-7-deazaguanine synthase QueE [Methanocella sp.]
MKSPIREIFLSAQGEGPYVGYRQLFVRFPKCNLECLYCDTPKDWGPQSKCRVETGPDKFVDYENPLSSEQLLGVIKLYERVHSVSLTGGEPLLYAKFIKELKSSKFPLYLETNMTLPDGAKEVKDVVKYVSGDFKLKNQCDWKGRYDKYFNDMARSFSILRQTSFRDCFCKIIVSEDIDREDMMHAIDQVKDCITELILQPVTPAGGVEAASPKLLLELQDMALEKVENVRIIPQTHKIWGAL